MRDCSCNGVSGPIAPGVVARQGGAVMSTRLDGVTNKGKDNPCAEQKLAVADDKEPLRGQNRIHARPLGGPYAEGGPVWRQVSSAGYA